MIARSSLPALVAALIAHIPSPGAPGGDDHDRRDAVVAGRVIDATTALPVVGARVRLRPPVREQFTDSAGRFRFAGLEAGTYRLEVDHVAFTPRFDSLVIEDATTVAIEVRIASEPVRLAPLDVTVRARVLEEVGFYQRQVAGSGTFFTRAEIERQRPRSVTDVIARLPGIRRDHDDFGRFTLHLNRSSRFIGASPDCPIQFFVDGGAGDTDAAGIDRLRPSSVLGIEVYLGPEAIPAQFNPGRAMCGAVVVWTRHR